MKEWNDKDFYYTDGSNSIAECSFILDILTATGCALTPNTLFSACKDKGFVHRDCQAAVWHLASLDYIEFTNDWKIDIKK